MKLKKINKNSKIFIAGHNGMVGSSLIRLFKRKNYKNILVRTKKQLDLLDQRKVFAFLKINKPEVVIIAAARVGGIQANNAYRGQFIYENLQIQNNLIHGSYLAGIKRLIFLGSSCIYPKNCKQPIKEEYLLTSPLEKTNEPYALAKIAGLKMIESYNKQYKTNFLCLMPCNLYGPNDNYDIEKSHFLPALLKKIHLAKKNNYKEITIWGDGTAKRELMYVDDLANACYFFLHQKITNHYLINIGSGYELNIKNYSMKIMKFLDCNLKIKFDRSKPNGTPRKILNSSIARNLGWRPEIKFMDGLKLTYSDYIKQQR